MTREQAEIVFAALANGAEVDEEALELAAEAWPGGVRWLVERQVMDQLGALN